MIFTDHFIHWAHKYLKEQPNIKNGVSGAGTSATIMMFSTDEDEEYEEDE
jgi:hypothetical protein